MPAASSSRLSRIEYCVVLAILCSLAACTSAPETRPPQQAMLDPGYLDALTVRIAAHEKLAAQQRASGDLAAASAHLQVLTLLAPEQERFRHQLESLRLQIGKTVAERLASGKAALRRGELDTATSAMLEVLALDPEVADAQQILREAERLRIAAKQAESAARFKIPLASTTPAKTDKATEKATEEQKTSTQAYEREQALELFGAGDTDGGLREIQRYASNYPNDRAGRDHLAALVFGRASEMVEQGKRENGLALMERAAALRGAPNAAWSTQIQAIRKALSADYYEQGWRAYRNDIAVAIKHWETSLRFDPNNANSALKLREAKRIQESLKRIKK